MMQVKGKRKKDLTSPRRTPGSSLKRRWIPAFAGMTIPFTVYLFTFTLSLQASPLAENQARFGEVSGTAQVLAQGSKHWSDAHKDLPIEVGDQIHVDDDSEAELSMTKNALWIAQANTDLIVGHTTTQEGRLTLTQGALLGKLEPSSSGTTGPWEFETPLGVCGVRGTEFVLLHTEQAGTHLAVMKGFVELQQAETATQTFPAVVINAHEEGVLLKKKSLKKLTTYSPAIQSCVKRLGQLQKRFHEIADVWSPLTEDYRTTLRHKYIPPVEHYKAPVRTPVRRSTRGY
jgi:hypothetical protein